MPDRTDNHPVDGSNVTMGAGIPAADLDRMIGATIAHEAIDLDPPAPEIVRWRELASRDIAIEHDGDAERVMPFPRPAWADPDGDIIGKSAAGSYYTSTWADVPLQHIHGANDETVLRQAHMRVRAKLCADGDRLVGLSTCRVVNGKWQWGEGVGMSLAEARELAAVLQAAADLVEGGADA